MRPKMGVTDYSGATCLSKLLHNSNYVVQTEYLLLHYIIQIMLLPPLMNVSEQPFVVKTTVRGCFSLSKGVTGCG